MSENQTAEVQAEQLGEVDSVNWKDPNAVVDWYGKQVIGFLRLMRKEKAGTRLRALNGALDSWTKAYRLASESSELEALKQRLDELQREIESSQRIHVAK